MQRPLNILLQGLSAKSITYAYVDIVCSLTCWTYGFIACMCGHQYIPLVKTVFAYKYLGSFRCFHNGCVCGWNQPDTQFKVVLPYSQCLPEEVAVRFCGDPVIVAAICAHGELPVTIKGMTLYYQVVV